VRYHRATRARAAAGPASWAAEAAARADAGALRSRSRLGISRGYQGRRRRR
jgi:hypothetical protein